MNCGAQSVETRQCRDCEFVLPLTAFYASNFRCRTCQNAIARRNRALKIEERRENVRERLAALPYDHPERVERRKRSNRWYTENKDRARATNRNSTLKRLYGVTEEQVRLLFESQGCACAICGTSDFRESAPHVDHCHKTGRVRGVLCGMCNRALGQFADDEERIERALEYLRRARKCA